MARGVVNEFRRCTGCFSACTRDEVGAVERSCGGKSESRMRKILDVASPGKIDNGVKSICRRIKSEMVAAAPTDERVVATSANQWG